MQSRRTLPYGQKVAKKFIEHYGGQLICARIRYDEQRRRRGATVEIISLSSRRDASPACKAI
jgi:hypothetical protein